MSVLNSLSPLICFATEYSSLRRLFEKGNNLNGKTGYVATKAPTLLQSTGVNLSWGFFCCLFVCNDSEVFFSFLFFSIFFLFERLTGQTLKPLICIQLGPSKGELRIRQAPFAWQRQEVGCKLLLFKPEWLFLFSLCHSLWGKKPISLLSKRTQKA